MSLPDGVVSVCVIMAFSGHTHLLFVLPVDVFDILVTILINGLYNYHTNNLAYMIMEYINLKLRTNVLKGSNLYFLSLSFDQNPSKYI